MKTWVIWIGCCISTYTISHSQSVTPRIDDIQPKTATITGNASGHIADLTLKNISDTEATFPGGYMYIPSDGQYQPYLVPHIPPTPIPPGQEVTIPVEGYCTDVNLPPAPRGTKIYLPDDIRPGDWISVAPPDPTLLDALKRIISVANQNYSEGITDHFVMSTEKEREVVIQQTFWIHTSSLAGKPYGFNEFCKTTTDQFSPMDEGTTTPAGYMDRALQTDISKLWRNIVEVGIKAEIPAFMQLPFPTFNPPTERTPIDMAYPDIANFATVKGTGLTTGHIADLTLTNPTDKNLIVTFGPGSEPFDGKPLSPGKPLPPGPPCFIPSSGGFQPYIVPTLGPFIVSAGQTKTVPVNGFCVDIHRPPVPSGEGMPSLSKWFMEPKVIDPNDNADVKSITTPSIGFTTGLTIAVIPTQVTMTMDQAVGTVIQSRPIIFSPVSPDVTTWNTIQVTDDGCLPVPISSKPTFHGTQSPMETTIDPDKNPELAVPLLLDAIQRISISFDELSKKGAIQTPFTSSPDKEREAVIQQTFWIYASGLTGSKYGKGDFLNQTIRQFENNVGVPFSAISPPQQDRINQGVADFWDTFEAVGVEAKVLSVPLDIPSTPVPSLQKGWENYNTAQAKVLD